jgi:hypothetical protein
MVGSNLAILLALMLSIALAASMGYRAVTRALARPVPRRRCPGTRPLFPPARLRPRRRRQPLPSLARLY